ncbi:uncharacterized protein BO80DRAFT_353755 [Aspergillus ibericus CBS 121593]|uniref:MARVEL domain-containing protein n=1 Tax=Aspergillus ibericus CBS 121593 TaxID=1448316 RepID=A0A395H5Y8_9EURO|nr:hypothetical protein BO80DRAFT_353755 [Aspergillus ibericus CBS 121593]RAL01684.1 hypothetical protein BO80DRAFT_353755 [Aspergillus ibericus CBS 121593]
MAVRIYHRRRRYHWPELQLNIWILVALSSSAICLGIFAWFMTVQNDLQLEVPWLFPYMITTSALGIFFVILILVLAAQRFLLPGIIIVGGFILFVLWLTGLVETSLQLYGVLANVNDNCRIYVDGAGREVGDGWRTLAWITEENICNCWRTAFAFELVNTIFYVWMIIMSWQVNRDLYR